eukprot:gene41108-50874_t
MKGTRSKSCCICTPGAGTRRTIWCSTTAPCWARGCTASCTCRKATWKMPKTGTTALPATFAAGARWPKRLRLLNPH